jgi:N-acetylglucosaminyldiphosphoundecaprenol N-acetyl-beta-D-mannosaminyltransferase
MLTATEPTAVRWPLKRDLFGVNVSATHYEEAVEAIIQSATAGTGGVATFLAVHGIVSATTNAEYRERVNRCQIVAPDGQPVKWAMNFFNGSGLTDRVYGPEILRRVCKRCEQAGLSVFFCGSTPQVLALLASRTRELYPDLVIAGVESPPFRQMTIEENDAICAKINHSGAAVVFIGLGVPRQEIFADSNRGKIRAVQCCVGAAFDFQAGTKKTAPSFMQRWWLEWLFRLYQEPRRLWKRYLFSNTIFTWLVIKNSLRKFFSKPAAPREVGA